MNEITLTQIEDLKQAEMELGKHAKDLRDEWAKPLVVNERGYIVSGVLWIPPFAYDFWSWRRKKPKPNKCVCHHCGNKHTLKGA